MHNSRTSYSVVFKDHDQYQLHSYTVLHKDDSTNVPAAYVTTLKTTLENGINNHHTSEWEFTGNWVAISDKKGTIGTYSTDDLVTKVPTWNLDDYGNITVTAECVQKATINYVPVGPEGLNADGVPNTTVAGSVNPTSETVSKATGTAIGSTATASSNIYKFVGWYSDADCTQWVSSNATYVPTKAEDDLWPEVSTYYAKFEYNLTTLTITKSGMQSIDAGQSFLFKVEGEGLPRGGLLIAINGNGSETISGLKVGEKYTIEEIGDWSWRYSAEKVTTDELVADGSKNSVTISNTRDEIYWLDGDCYAENVFSGVKP